MSKSANGGSVQRSVSRRILLFQLDGKVPNIVPSICPALESSDWPDQPDPAKLKGRSPEYKNRDEKIFQIPQPKSRYDDA